MSKLNIYIYLIRLNEQALRLDLPVNYSFTRAKRKHRISELLWYTLQRGALLSEIDRIYHDPDRIDYYLMWQKKLDISDKML